MLFRTSLKQTLRTPVKLVAYFLITALVAAFLCVGLNLYQKSEENIVAAEDCFTTIAMPEAYAEMTRGGTLMREFTEEDYAPFLLTDEQIANMGLPAGTKAYGSFPPESDSPSENTGRNTPPRSARALHGQIGAPGSGTGETADSQPSVFST